MAPRPPVPRRWKLWHFAVLVLLTALAFGSIRAIARDLGDLSAPARAVLAEVAGVTIFWLTVTVVWLKITKATSRRPLETSRWPVNQWKLWGLRKGGVVGFLISVVGVVLDLMVFGALLLFGTIGLPLLISFVGRLVGR